VGGARFGLHHPPGIRSVKLGCKMFILMALKPNIAFHGTPTRALRGSGPVNSNR